MDAKKGSLNEEQIKEWIEQGIKKLEKFDCSDKKHKHHIHKSGSGGGLWFLGFIGALIYFWQYVNSFGSGIVAILKAFVWPAYLVYNLFVFLKI